MSDHANAQPGVLLATDDPRVKRVHGLPWGVVGKTNLGPLAWARDRLTIPRDESVLMANIAHDRTQPIGRMFDLEVTDRGLDFSVRIADTPEGDTLLAEQAQGRKNRFSVEVRDIVRRGSEALAGTLFGGAFVDRGAYEGAELYAEEYESSSHAEYEYTDENGVTWRRVENYESTTEQTEAADGSIAEVTTSTTTATETPVEDTSDEDTDTEGEDAVGNATPTDTLEASARTATPQRTGLQTLARALAGSHKNNDATLLAGLAERSGATLFAELSDIAYDGAGAPGNNMRQPAYIGELWSGRIRPRRVIPLISSAPLQSLQEIGWKWGVKPAVARWTGNKADVPSNDPTTAPATFAARRYAGAHDIAREYVDFNAEEFWAAYLKAMTESYSELTDNDALADLLAAATEVTPGTVPAGINAATAGLVDGAIATLDKDAPSFAIVAKDVFRQLLLQSKDDLIATLSLGLGLEDGDLAGFRLVAHEGMEDGTILVGTRAAATHKELPGSPIRVDAEDLARGGVDRGFFGYAGTQIHEPLGLSLVTLGA